MKNKIKKLIKYCLKYGLLFPSMILGKKSMVSSEEALTELKKIHYKVDLDISANNKIFKEFDLMIIIPVYNVEKYIKECIDSVLNQVTKYNYNIVIINDGSTDQSGEILKAYQSYSNIKIITQENRGLSGARNRGLEYINGRYIMFLDSDDTLPVNAIEKLMNVAMKNNLDLGEGSMVRIDDLGEIYPNDNVIFNNSKLSGFAWGKVYKAEIFKDIKFPTGVWFEDGLIEYSVIPKCEKYMLIEDIVYNYRFNSSSITSSSHGKPKSLETYYTTMDFWEKNKPNWNENQLKIMQERILYQIILNYGRTKKMGDKVTEYGFVLMRDLYINSYKSDEQLTNKNKKIAKCLRSGNYSEFKIRNLV